MGQRRLGLGPGLPCLSLAGAPEPQGSGAPTPHLSAAVDRGGGGVGAMGWPRGRDRPGRLGGRDRRVCESVSERVGQQGSLLMASHRP